MTVHAEVFNTRRDHLRTQKASELLAAGDPTGELTPLPNCRPSQSLTPLSALRAGAKQTRAPKLLLNWGPSEPCYATGTKLSVPESSRCTSLIGLATSQLHSCCATHVT